MQWFTIVYNAMIYQVYIYNHVQVTVQWLFHTSLQFETISVQLNFQHRWSWTCSTQEKTARQLRANQRAWHAIKTQACAVRRRGGRPKARQGRRAAPLAAELCSAVLAQRRASEAEGPRKPSAQITKKNVSGVELCIRHCNSLITTHSPQSTDIETGQNREKLPYFCSANRVRILQPVPATDTDRSLFMFRLSIMSHDMNEFVKDNSHDGSDATSSFNSWRCS